jgi:DNA (cytosine-5)-methyltransferase 1
MAVYYNEIDAYAAQWLRNLIATGELPPGDVDTRSIVDVGAVDLAGYDECHFFAGIAGWPYALRLAGWPGDRPVWTGSCPCQPLSSAGQRKGHADERHLWPAFYRLIAECRPATIFGEQVASADGREWLAGVRADLEGLGYAVGAADLCAASVGAPHIRQRLFWVADASGIGRGNYRELVEEKGNGIRTLSWKGDRVGIAGGNSTERRLADAGEPRRGALLGPERENGRQTVEPDGQCDALRLGNAPGLAGPISDQQRQEDLEARGAGPATRRLGDTESGHWSDAVWLSCLDGKARRVEPGVFPLADGVPGRVGRLRGYGNAIVPPLAAQFVVATMEAVSATNR